MELTYTEYIKNLFADKKIGDKFEVDMKGNSIAVVRAAINNNIKMDYRTRYKHGVLTVQILGMVR